MLMAKLNFVYRTSKGRFFLHVHRGLYAVAVLVLLSIACAAGCGSKNSAPSTETKTIDSNGGIVTFEDGLSVSIPAGALANAVEITIQKSAESRPTDALTDVYEFGPSGTTFLQPVTVTFPAPEGTGDFAVYWTKLNDETAYEILPTTVSGGLVTAQTMHFSKGFVGLQPTGTLSATLYFYPSANETEINYKITGNGINPITGTIPITSNPMSTIIVGMPPGTGYIINLDTADGMCSDAASFDVTANQITTEVIQIQCYGSQSPAPVGNLLVELNFPPSSNETEINYKITRNGFDIKSGTIQVTPNLTTANLGQIKVGSYYTINVATADGVFSGSVSFDVQENLTTAVHIEVLCSSNLPPGISKTTCGCPEITSMIASPNKTNVGGVINVSASAENSDQGALTYAWTATAGYFANPSATATTYTCSLSGFQTLIITVRNVMCSDSRSVIVTCL